MLPLQASAGLKALHPRYLGPGIGAKEDARSLEPVVLEPAGGIAGLLTDAATGKPLAGAVIGAQLIEYRRRILGGWGETVTDDHGRFAITGLEPGVYNLLLIRVPRRPEATSRAVEGLRVRVGADTPADLTVIQGRPVRGVVIDQQTDRPVVGIHVGCYGPARPHSGAGVESRKTDDQGRFTFHVPPGEQYVYLMDGTSSSRLSRRNLVVPEQGEIEPVRLVWTSRTTNAMMGMMKAEARPIEPAKAAVGNAAKDELKAEAYIRAGQPALAKIPEEAKPPPPKVRTVTGRVRDEQGRSLLGVHLNVDPGPPAPGAQPEPIDIATTDRDGMFILSGLPLRPLQINLNRTGSQFQTELLPADRNAVEWTYRLVPDPRNQDRPAPSKDEPIPPELRQRLTFLDLTLRGNDFLANGPGEGGNDLNRLPRGVHKLGDAYFRIGESMVHVQGQIRSDLPQAIKGIKVGAQGQTLHILHATQYRVDPGTLIGAYIVHYVDGSSERIPIIYGRSLVDWWRFRGSNAEPAEAKVAWTGSNDTTDLNPGLTIRLFAMTWTNPHPEKAIATLDVLSAGKQCDPFLVAMTLVRH
jgi:hypothetical protein